MVDMTARRGGPDGSRPVTLDPLHEHEIVLTARRVESTLGCGFRMEWLSVDDGTKHGFQSAELTAGAGVGSKWMTLQVKMEDGSLRQECIDVAALMEQWIDAVVRGPETPPWWVGQYPDDTEVEVWDLERWLPGRVTACTVDGLVIEGPRVDGDSRSLQWTVAGDEIPKRVRQAVA